MLVFELKLKITYVLAGISGKFFFPFSHNNSLNRQLSFRVKVLNHMGVFLATRGCYTLKHGNKGQ